MTTATNLRWHPNADHWDVLTRLASRYLDPAWDPWRSFTLPAGGRPDLIPDIGPVVYIAMDDHRCFWAGQTQDLQDRFRGHLSYPYRRNRWQRMAAIKLVTGTPARIVDRLELDTAMRFQPVDGRCWPRVRR